MGSDEEDHSTNGTRNGHEHYHDNTSISVGDRLSDHQKQGLILILLSAIIYLACQFEMPDFVLPEAVEGPKPKAKIQMIALIGERNSGTRWTSEYVSPKKEATAFDNIMKSNAFLCGRSLHFSMEEEF